ncbi:MAG TPA: UDP-N-acetylmuramoyl-L-alanyl-D-glutamate--2,6-diaminopimelate ligase [Gemmatimonadaceae bacterium]|nr:UDP-N-acetylmuramoyl-L-alanyl-D-glutamate--2,6-diaminopimelate ligase [Gemmatimonadaceae bacterium]
MEVASAENAALSALAPIVEALRTADLLIGIAGDLPSAVSDIADDSRAIRPGALFVAVKGTERDGHEFLPDAQRRGAAAAIVEDPARTALPSILVRDGRAAAAIAAAAFFHEPASAIRTVAVTGTNGKTTTVGMLRHLLDEPPGASASIGTIGVVVGSRGTPLGVGAGLTTPGPIELQRVLRALSERGVTTVAMEVSSHSLEQRRIEGMRFRTAVFTNLTRDHLDYHGTMELYFEAKARLISHLTPDGVAVVNADDVAWSALPPAPRRLKFGSRGQGAEVWADDVRFMPRGSTWTLVAEPSPVTGRAAQRAPVTLPLIGDFNVVNALGASAAAIAMGMSAADVAERLATLPQVPGRLEIVLERPTVLRDYAHTPDALERALHAVRPFVRGRLTVVFGCGGDRDRGKRPVMGELAERLADQVILTSDNPRTEDPEHILDEIEAGMKGRHERIEDRREAIAHALAISSPDDVILLAGKGHETYQIRGTTRLPFDEREIVRVLAGERT